MAINRSNQMQWDNVGGSGLSDAVGNAAVATAGLVEANNGIAGLADRFIGLGESISNKATERRNKALDEYTNNLFNESLQGAMNADGTVNSGKLIQNLQTFRARDKANGEFWSDEEVGNKIGALTLKYNDSFVKNAELIRSNKQNEALQQEVNNMKNTQETQRLITDFQTEYSNQLNKYHQLQREAARLNLTLNDPELLNEMSNLLNVFSKNMTYKDENGFTHYRSASDRGTADIITKMMADKQAISARAAKRFSEWQLKIEKAKAEEAENNAKNLKGNTGA